MINQSRALVLFFLTVVFVSLQLMHSTAQGSSSYFTSKGCSGCHSAPVVATCNGCHAHGTHPDSTKKSINVAGATNKTTYAPGETVTVTITGGYRTGWFRAVLYNQSGVEVARSTGNDSGMGSSATYPATLSAAAPATPGAYTWKAGWYGNQYDASAAAFGAEWTVDATNPSHGYEIVNTNSFTVTAAAPTISTVTPNTFPQGAVSQSVTITGSNLTGGTVSFSNPGVTGGAATITATSITLPVSVATSAVIGAGTVTVNTAGGSISSAFTVSAASQYTLSVTLPAGTGGGAVNGGSVSKSSSIACTTGTCTATYPPLTSITLTETPDSISTFGSWGGACSGSKPTCTFSMAGDLTVTATFNGAPMAMIGSTGYTSLSAAYLSAGSVAVIDLLSTDMVGDLNMDQGKIITIRGGFDPTFSINTGQPTGLKGLLTVATGSLTVDNLAVK